MLQVAYETNTQESSEFLETYLSIRTTLKCVKYLLLIILFEWGIHKLHAWKKPQWLTVTGHYSLLLYIIYCGVFFFRISPAFSHDWTANREQIYENPRILEHMLGDSFIWNTNQALLQFADEQSSFEICSKNQRGLGIDTSTLIKTNIVLIIGESFNRHHSSLYGYGLGTNPKLSSLNNLFVYEDVISSINVTSPSFKNFLSLSSVDEHRNWYDSPLFPSIFKNAGYNVVFFSNQFVKELNMSQHDASCGFFNHPDIEPLLFNHRNNQKFEFDEDLLNDYKKHRQEIEQDSLNLVIFHLMGQHVSPSKRFPKEHTFFTQKDYNRPGLSPNEIQQVADYDNATRYNDSIVYEIIQMYLEKEAIILYYADHGDEANDYRIHIGRSLRGDTMTAPCLHCQLDIPFIFYLSNPFVSKYPELSKRIESAYQQPFMIDDLPHLLLDIAGIKTEWYKPERSPINKEFNSHRQRIIQGYSFNKPIDYDSVCKEYGPWEIGSNTIK